MNVAAAGDRIEMASGSYSGQSLGGDSGGPVTFVAQPGAQMGGRLVLQGLRHVTFEGLAFPRSDPLWELQLDSCNTDITFHNVVGRRFLIFEGNSQITFSGGSWGGYSNYGDEDSGIGTTGATGPTRSCNGAPAPMSSDILFDQVTFHDVHWGQTVAQSGSHPDCMAIDGYVDGVTFHNSTFTRCANSFLMVTPDQGPIYRLTLDGNTFSDLGNDSYFGIQLTDSGGKGCGDYVFKNNQYHPNNPNGNYPYSSIRTNCAPSSGHSSTEVTGNVFQKGPPSNECAIYLNPPYSTRWHDNTFEMAPACGTNTPPSTTSTSTSTTTTTPPPPTAKALLIQSWATMQTASLYKKWAQQNSGEAAKLTAYWNTGGTRPTLATSFGQALALEAQARWASP